MFKDSTAYVGLEPGDRPSDLHVLDPESTLIQGTRIPVDVIRLTETPVAHLPVLLGLEGIAPEDGLPVTQEMRSGCARCERGRRPLIPGGLWGYVGFTPHVISAANTASSDSAHDQGTWRCGSAYGRTDSL